VAAANAFDDDDLTTTPPSKRVDTPLEALQRAVTLLGALRNRSGNGALVRALHASIALSTSVADARRETAALIASGAAKADVQGAVAAHTTRFARALLEELDARGLVVLTGGIANDALILELRKDAGSEHVGVRLYGRGHTLHVPAAVRGAGRHQLSEATLAEALTGFVRAAKVELPVDREAVALWVRGLGIGREGAQPDTSATGCTRALLKKNLPRAAFAEMKTLLRD
jgi:hypothetical protein